jgi:hypothetical protein
MKEEWEGEAIRRFKKRIAQSNINKLTHVTQKQELTTDVTNKHGQNSRHFDQKVRVCPVGQWFLLFFRVR